MRKRNRIEKYRFESYVRNNLLVSIYSKCIMEMGYENGSP